jgi:acetyl-CoA synthetase
MLTGVPARFPRPADPEKLACGTDPLLIFFSSGTTGMPKMVEHTHQYPLGHLFTGMYWHDLEATDIHLTVADTGWGKAVWGKSYGQWMAGAAVFVYDFRGKFNPPALLRVIAEHGVTTFCAPPTVYRFLIREDLARYDLTGLRHCTTAGELLNESVYHAWKEATGLSIYEGFGQTESTLQIATLPCMTPKPGSIGKPVPGWDVRVLNAEDEVCAPGDEGEICIRVSERHPYGLFSGYLDEPEQTAKAMHDGWYHTGDKAWVDEDGYYWFLGRIDDLIKTSGYRVGPFEVESALVAHDAVIEAAVTAVPDPVRGQAVKATIVLRPGITPSEELTRELQDYVKHVTAPYKYPRVVEYVAELPKTISGKIKRSEIRCRDAEIAKPKPRDVRLACAD